MKAKVPVTEELLKILKDNSMQWNKILGIEYKVDDKNYEQAKNKKFINWIKTRKIDRIVKINFNEWKQIFNNYDKEILKEKLSIEEEELETIMTFLEKESSLETDIFGEDLLNKLKIFYEEKEYDSKKVKKLEKFFIDETLDKFKSFFKEEPMNKLETFFNEKLILIKWENKQQTYISSTLRKNDTPETKNYVYDKFGIFSLKIKYLINFYFQNVKYSINSLENEVNKEKDVFSNRNNFNQAKDKLTSLTFYLPKAEAKNNFSISYLFRQLMNYNFDNINEDEKDINKVYIEDVKKEKDRLSFINLDFLFSLFLLRDRNTFNSLEFLGNKISKIIDKLEEDEEDSDILEIFQNFIKLARFKTRFFKDQMKKSEIKKNNLKKIKEYEIKVSKTVSFINFFVSSASLLFDLTNKKITFWENLKFLEPFLKDERVNENLIFSNTKKTNNSIRHNLFPSNDNNIIKKYENFIEELINNLKTNLIEYSKKDESEEENLFLKEFFLLGNPTEYKRKIKKYDKNGKHNFEKTETKRAYYFNNYTPKPEEELISQEERIHKIKANMKWDKVKKYQNLDFYKFHFIKNLTLLLERHLRNYQGTIISIEEENEFVFETKYEKIEKIIPTLSPFSTNIKVQNNILVFNENKNSIKEKKAKLIKRVEWYLDGQKKAPNYVEKFVFPEEAKGIKEEIIQHLKNPQKLLDSPNSTINVEGKYSLSLEDVKVKSNTLFTSQYYFPVNKITSKTTLKTKEKEKILKENLYYFPKVVEKELNSFFYTPKLKINDKEKMTEKQKLKITQKYEKNKQVKENKIKDIFNFLFEKKNLVFDNDEKNIVKIKPNFSLEETKWDEITWNKENHSKKELAEDEFYISFEEADKDINIDYNNKFPFFIQLGEEEKDVDEIINQKSEKIYKILKTKKDNKFKEFVSLIETIFYKNKFVSKNLLVIYNNLLSEKQSEKIKIDKSLTKDIKEKNDTLLANAFNELGIILNYDKKEIISKVYRLKEFIENQKNSDDDKLLEKIMKKINYEESQEIEIKDKLNIIIKEWDPILRKIHDKVSEKIKDNNYHIKKIDYLIKNVNDLLSFIFTNNQNKQNDKDFKAKLQKKLIDFLKKYNDNGIIINKTIISSDIKELPNRIIGKNYANEKIKFHGKYEHLFMITKTQEELSFNSLKKDKREKLIADIISFIKESYTIIDLKDDFEFKRYRIWRRIDENNEDNKYKILKIQLFNVKKEFNNETEELKVKMNYQISNKIRKNFIKRKNNNIQNSEFIKEKAQILNYFEKFEVGFNKVQKLVYKDFKEYLEKYTNINNENENLSLKEVQKEVISDFKDYIQNMMYNDRNDLLEEKTQKELETYKINLDNEIDLLKIKINYQIPDKDLQKNNFEKDKNQMLSYLNKIENKFNESQKSLYIDFKEYLEKEIKKNLSLKEVISNFEDYIKNMSMIDNNKNDLLEEKQKELEIFKIILDDEVDKDDFIIKQTIKIYIKKYLENIKHYEDMSKHFLISLIQNIFVKGEKIIKNKNVDINKQAKFNNLMNWIKRIDVIEKIFKKDNKTSYKNESNRPKGKRYSKRYHIEFKDKNNVNYINTLAIVLKIMKDNDFNL